MKFKLGTALSDQDQDGTMLSPDLWNRLVVAAPQSAQVSETPPAASTPPGAATFTTGALTYTENFNSLASTGTGTGAAYAGGTLLGTTDFVFAETGGTGQTTYTAGTGSSSTGDTYSFGSTGSIDRAIGSVASGTVTNSYYGIQFTNNTGSTITSLSISYVGELWRLGGRTVANGPDRLDFQYSTTATTVGATSGYTDFDALDFVSPATLPSAATGVGGGDGNAAGNRTAISSNLSVNIAPGGTIFIRWADGNVVGSDDGLAIDDFSITATLAQAGPTVSINDVSIAEGNGGTSLLTFTITRSDNSGAFSVDYATADGSATLADGDYQAASGTASFAAGGALTQTVSVTINGDTTFEADETLFLNLTNLVNTTGTASIADGQGVGTITNDDVTIIPAGSFATTYTVSTAATHALLANTTRQVTANVVGVTVSANNATVDIEGTLSGFQGARAIDGSSSATGETILIGSGGTVTTPNGDAIRFRALNGSYTITNLGQVLVTNNNAPPTVGGTNLGNAHGIVLTAVQGAAGAPSTDFTSGGTITNGSVGNTAALIRSDAGDAVRLGSHQTLVNYGTINGGGPINDASTNNVFNPAGGNTVTTQTYGISRGIRIDDDGIANSNGKSDRIDNFGTISGSQHGIDFGDPDSANSVIVNELGGLIVGNNGSGIGADTTGIAASTITVQNSGIIRGAHAQTVVDRAGYTSTNGTGDGDGDGVDVDGGATIVNNAGATIEGTGAAGYDSNGRANQSEGISIGGGSITNAGTISGANTAIVTNNDSNANGSRSGVGATTIVNNAAGTITGAAGYAIRLENKTGTAIDNDSLTNYGTITGNGAIPDPAGIVLRQDGTPDASTVGTLDGVAYTSADAGNARFIRGDGAAIQMGEGADTLADYGTIVGNSSRAINLEGGADTLTLYTGSSITGRIDGGAGTDSLVLKLDDRVVNGGGAAGNNSGATTGTLSNVVGFEALDVAGGTWTIGDGQSYGNGVTIESGAILALNTGAALSGAIADSGRLKSVGTGTVTLADLISGNGIVEQAGSGTLVLSHAGNGYSGGTILSAGTLDVATLGAAGTGTITFGAGAETLRVEVAATNGGAFTNVLAGFGADGDVLDAAGIGLATASYDASSGVLTLTGTTTETFTIGTGYGGYTFHTADDGAGGTNLTATLPSLTVGDVSVIEGDAGSKTLVFTITSSAAALADGISVHFATADGSATAGSDYVAASGTATILAGDTSTTVSITVNGDTLFERNETLIVNLSNPANALIADGQGVGTIGNDDPVPATAPIFSTDFAGFTAAGFAPGGVAGGLDSNIWRVVGLSDNATPAFGFTATTGDFARGLLNNSAPSTAGVYSPSSDNALVVQPTQAELESGGFIEARIQNNSGATATSFDLVFDWAYRNTADRADNMQLAFSTDGLNFTTVPAAAFSTPATKDASIAALFTDVHESVTLTGTVADAGYLYVRWVHASSSGINSRDEVGIDNVGVTAHLSSAPTGSISDISFNEGDNGQTQAVFTITRSNGIGAASVDYATADVTAVAGSDYVAQSGTVTFADGELAKTVTILVNGDHGHEANETFLLNLSNAQGFVTPSSRATATIVNDDAGPIAIYDLQGLGHASPFVGQSVTTTGIVTAVDSNGYYLQDPTGDGNANTSDAIFVFTAGAPAVAIGDGVSVTGTISEFAANADSLSTTEINSPTTTILTHSNPMPASVVIGTGGLAVPSTTIDDDHLTSYDPQHDAIDFYESIEGMLVTVKAPSVVSDTDSFGDTYVVASNGADATGLNARGGLTLEPGDTQPERIHISTDAGINPGFGNPHWTQGDKLNDVTGIITYFSSTYQLIPTTTPVLAQDITLPREVTALHGDVNHLSIGTYNLENYDPSDHKEMTLATDLITNLGGPDIIGVEEVQDDNGAATGGNFSAQQNLTNLVDAMNALDPTAHYQFVEIDPTAEGSTGGEPGGNIRNAFLYDANRVTYVPNSLQIITGPAFTNSRNPLVAQFVFNGQTITAIDMHSYSRGGSGADFGDTQPPAISGDDRRTAMGQAVRDWLDAHPQPHVAVMGDFNGYYYEGGLQALQNTNANGAGLTNLAVALLAPEERYSYQFDGANELFDHILVSPDLVAGASYDAVHLNAEYSANASRPTDHDPQVALIFVNAPAIARADDFTTDEASAITAFNVKADNGHGADSDPENDPFAVTAVNGVAGNVGMQISLASGALLRLNADGTFSYDPNHKFDYLVSASTAASTGAVDDEATDSFTYTLAGGSTATVLVHVNGLDSAGDRLGGGGGNDDIVGTSSADHFDLSQGGNDSASGGESNDGFFMGAAFTPLDHVDGGGGANDQVGLEGDYTGVNKLVLDANTMVNVEGLVVLPGHSYDITTNDGNVASGERLMVQATQLNPGESLTFNGAAESNGSFLIFASNGDDHLTGGAKNDGFYFGPGQFTGDDIVNGGGGTNDQLGLDGNYGSFGTPFVLDDNVTNVEMVVLLPGPSSNLNHFNVTTSDAFVPNGQAMTIYAVEVTTNISFDGSHESSSAFTIFGGGGHDTYTGGGGGDWLFGGYGADQLAGGLGADTFFYDDAAQSTSLGYDKIAGFDETVDKIDLPFTVTGFAAPGSGSLDSGSFDSDLANAFAGLTSHQAGLFTATSGNLSGHTFLVVDADGTPGYQAGTDYVIEMVTPATPIDNPVLFV